MRTHPIEHYQALHDSAPCPSRAATLPKGTKLELGRVAHLGTPSSANHTAAASQPTGRIAKAVSWLHLSRVSPALHSPERPSHTHTPKPGFGRRGHEDKCVTIPYMWRELVSSRGMSCSVVFLWRHVCFALFRFRLLCFYQSRGPSSNRFSITAGTLCGKERPILLIGSW